MEVENSNVWSCRLGGKRKGKRNYMAVRLWSFDNDIGMLPVSWLSERNLQ
jgi:hypothetical protein